MKYKLTLLALLLPTAVFAQSLVHQFSYKGATGNPTAVAAGQGSNKVTPYTVGAAYLYGAQYGAAENGALNTGMAGAAAATPGAKSAASTLTGGAQSTGNTVASGASSAGNTVASGASSAGNTVASGVSSAGNSVAKAFSGI